MIDETIRFKLQSGSPEEMKEIMKQVYSALNQIVGYILSEDPTYITTHNNARSLIRKVDRDELLQQLVKDYLD